MIADDIPFYVASRANLSKIGREFIIELELGKDTPYPFSQLSDHWVTLWLHVEEADSTPLRDEGETDEDWTVRMYEAVRGLFNLGLPNGLLISLEQYALLRTHPDWHEVEGQT